MEIVACEIRIDTLTFNIANVYCSPNLKYTKDDFENVFNAIPDPKIITGDFNAHSKAWGCFDDNSRGKILLEAISNENMVFLNNGSMTHISTPPTSGQCNRYYLQLHLHC